MTFTVCFRAGIGDPQAVLINGVGTYDPVSGGPAYDNSTAAIVVERGTTYRLRIICAAGLSYMRFAIEGMHTTHHAVCLLCCALLCCSYICPLL
jgi:Multicopper oxidase